MTELRRSLKAHAAALEAAARARDADDERAFESAAAFKQWMASIVRECRRRTGLDREEFARKVAKSNGWLAPAQTIWRWETAQDVPYGDSFIRVLEAGGFRITTLLSEWVMRGPVPVDDEVAVPTGEEVED